MTSPRDERLAALVRELAADLRADELPPVAHERAVALQFYARSRRSASEEERFLALYNALGALVGFRQARQEIDALLGGGVDAALRAAHGDGDCEERVGRAARFPYAGDRLDRLASDLRRRLLAP